MKIDRAASAGTSFGVTATQWAAVTMTCGETTVPVHHSKGFEKLTFLIMTRTAPESSVSTVAPMSAAEASPVRDAGAAHELARPENDKPMTVRQSAERRTMRAPRANSRPLADQL